jgi:hypothetical protein
MPTELRQLVFSADELAQALSAMSEAVPGRLPAGDIIMCQVVESPDLHVNVKVLPEGSPDLQNIHLDSAFVGASLVKFCLDRKIPLPSGSVRHLQAISGNIALNLSIGSKRSALPGFV